MDLQCNQSGLRSCTKTLQFCFRKHVFSRALLSSISCATWACSDPNPENTCQIVVLCCWTSLFRTACCDSLLGCCSEWFCVNKNVFLNMRQRSLVPTRRKTHVKCCFILIILHCTHWTKQVISIFPNLCISRTSAFLFCNSCFARMLALSCLWQWFDSTVCDRGFGETMVPMQRTWDRK